jgi:molecular chaperone GrpE
MHARGKESIAEDIIPVLDSFDMATGSEALSMVGEEWRGGMEMIRNQLLDVLARHGIERFGKVGEPFDHTIHEAMQEVDDVVGEGGVMISPIAKLEYNDTNQRWETSEAYRDKDLETIEKISF